MWPVAQAIALGPVPDGSMKPQLAAQAAGSASRIGSMPVAAMIPATTGMIPLAAATLDANSVITTTIATSTSATTSGCTARSGWSAVPSQSPSPDAPMPAASARPPPNSMITPHGARLASSQLSSARPVPSGITNSSSAPAMAIVPSVSESSGR